MKTGFFLSFALLSLLALVTAAPSKIQKRSFKVERVPNSGFTGRNGPQALAKAYRKFGVPVPQTLVDVLDAQKAAKASRLAKRATTFLDLGSIHGVVDRKHFPFPGDESC